MWPRAALVQGPLIPQGHCWLVLRPRSRANSGLPTRRWCSVWCSLTRICAPGLPGKSWNLGGISRTQACFSGCDSLVMGPCFSSHSSHGLWRNIKKKKNQRCSRGLWDASGGTKERDLRSQCWGSSGQTVALRASAGASRSPPTAAPASSLPASYQQEQSTEVQPALDGNPESGERDCARRPLG